MKRKMGSLTIWLAVIGVATAIIATLFGVASLILICREIITINKKKRPNGRF